jgi:hypothetical protein
MAFCAPQNIPAFIKNSLEINLVYFVQRSRTQKNAHEREICERLLALGNKRRAKKLQSP